MFLDDIHIHVPNHSTIFSEFRIDPGFRLLLVQLSRVIILSYSFDLFEASFEQTGEFVLRFSQPGNFGASPFGQTMTNPFESPTPACPCLSSSLLTLTLRGCLRHERPVTGCRNW